MLTEQLLASTSKAHPGNYAGTKDAGIFLYEVRPHVTQRAAYKKSITTTNSLAVTRSHIFALQEGKAVVHVYGRAKGNLETVIPFPEPLCSIKLVMQDTLAMIGTAKGRILLWEICTGYLVSTSQSHLKPVTLLAIDPTSCFLLSGSADATALVWSIPGLLSFSSTKEDRRPLRTNSEHRSGLTALTVGHSSFSANIAVSTDKDSKAIVWDYRTGEILRIILLESPPLALVLDPADRALYASYTDGSVQMIDFFRSAGNKSTTPIANTIHDTTSGHTAALQPDPETIVSAPSQNLGCAHSLALSWDTTTLISGHESGKIVIWDIAHRMYTSLLSTLPGPVTNLIPLSPTGFATDSDPPSLEIQTIVKPKISLGAPDAKSSTLIPPEYTMSVRFPSTLPLNNDIQSPPSVLETLFTQPGVPQSIIDQGRGELNDCHEASSASSKKFHNGPAQTDLEADFVPLSEGHDDTADKTADEIAGLKEQNRRLQVQLETLQRVQKVTFAQLAGRKENERVRNEGKGEKAEAQ